jgi:hypothetical protein
LEGIRAGLGAEHAMLIDGENIQAEFAHGL